MSLFDLYARNELHVYKVRLEDGTTGTYKQVFHNDALEGQLIGIYTNDPNGTPRHVVGTCAEILEHTTYGGRNELRNTN